MFIPTENLQPPIKFFQAPDQTRQDISNLWAIRQELAEIMEAKPGIDGKVFPLFDTLNRMLSYNGYNPKANFPPYDPEL